MLLPFFDPIILQPRKKHRDEQIELILERKCLDFLSKYDKCGSCIRRDRLVN